MRRLATLALGLAAAVAGAVALAQGSYPARPIRIVVPFPAGGTADVLGRVVAQRLGAAYGHNVFVDNRPGASGHVGAEQVARSAGDGYTLMIGTIGIHAAYSIYRRLNYNPATELQPVMALAELPNVLVVHPSLPARDVREFLTLAKSRPGELHFGSAGPGSSTHMVAELFKLASGADLTHVPYKGSAPALTDLVGGQIQLMFENLPTALPLLQAGRIRALGVTAARRAPSLPQVPTIDEAGVRGYSATSWFTLAAPRAVPAPLIDKINADVHRVLTAPDASEDFRKQSITLIAGTPAEANVFFASETQKWTRVINAANIRLD